MRLSPALRRVSSHLLESEPSRTRSRLSEPLWGDGALRADFMVRASQLNAILEREVSESGSVDSLDTVCARSPRARERAGPGRDVDARRRLRSARRRRARARARPAGAREPPLSALRHFLSL